MDNNIALFQKYNKTTHSGAYCTVAVVKIQSFGQTTPELKLICCKDAEIEQWKENDASLYDVYISAFDAEFEFKGLATDDFPNPIDTSFNATFRIVPNDKTADFLLSQMQDKDAYTFDDLKNDLANKYNIKGFIRRILAGKKYELLEKYGKGAVDWEGLSDELPSFLAIGEINKFEVSAQIEQNTSTPKEEIDEATKAAKAFEAELNGIKENFAITQTKLLAETELASFQEKRNNAEMKLVISAGELEAAKIRVAAAITEAKNSEATALQEKIYIDSSRVHAAKTQAEISKDKDNIGLIESKTKVGVARDNRFLSWLKSPRTIACVILVMLAAAAFFGMALRNRLQRQKPELLIIVADYENARRQYNEIWGKLTTEFATPTIYEDKAEFRGTMTESRRKELIGYLKSRENSYIRLLSISKEKLPDAKHDLIGYELRMKMQFSDNAIVVVIGNEKADELRKFLYDTWGVSGRPQRHQSIPNAITYNVNAPVSDIIGMKKDMQNMFGVTKVDADDLSNTVTVYLPNNKMRQYHFILDGISASKQAEIQKIFGEDASFDPGVVKVICRQNDIPKYRTALEKIGVEWIEATAVPEAGTITVTLRELHIKLSYKAIWFSTTPDSAQSLCERMRSIGNDVSAQAGMPQKVGSRYVHSLYMTSYTQSEKEVELWLKSQFGLEAEITANSSSTAVALMARSIGFAVEGGSYQQIRELVLSIFQNRKCLLEPDGAVNEISMANVSPEQESEFVSKLRLLGHNVIEPQNGGNLYKIRIMEKADQILAIEVDSSAFRVQPERLSELQRILGNGITGGSNELLKVRKKDLPAVVQALQDGHFDCKMTNDNGVQKLVIQEKAIRVIIQTSSKLHQGLIDTVTKMFNGQVSHPSNDRLMVVTGDSGLEAIRGALREYVGEFDESNENGSCTLVPALPQKHTVRVILSKGDSFDGQRASLLKAMSSEGAKGVFAVASTEEESVGNRHFVTFHIESYQNINAISDATFNLLGKLNIKRNKVSID